MEHTSVNVGAKSPAPGSYIIQTRSSSVSHRDPRHQRTYWFARASKVVHAFISTHLDYYNHIFRAKCELKSNNNNTTACFVTDAKKYDPIRPALIQLYWLPVSCWIVFKHLFVCKPLNDLLPSLFGELPICRSSQDLLMQPTSATEGYGDRAFADYAPKPCDTFII